MRQDELDRALRLGSEAADLDFKSMFNPSDKGEFLEIIKDIVAMANSGGGIILFGVHNDGQPSAADLRGLASFDPAKISDAIYKYTDCQFGGFELCESVKRGHTVWAIGIGPTEIPIVFSQTGNYAESSGKQRNSFLGGTVYFRHGAKSEPGNSEDLRIFIDNRLQSVRSEWLSGIAKVVEAPAGSVIQVVPPTDQPVRLTMDPKAASLPVGSVDVGWPYRQKEVLAEVNKSLSGRKSVNANHVLSVRRAHDVEANGVFCYTQRHVSPKYSQAFVDWIIAQYHADSEFFEKAKVIADHRRSKSPSEAAATAS
jgi:hypothetical protein